MSRPKTFNFDNHTWTVCDVSGHTIIFEKEDGCRYAVIKNNIFKFDDNRMHLLSGESSILERLLLGNARHYYLKLFQDPYESCITSMQSMDVKTFEHRGSSLVFENIENIYMKPPGDILYYRASGETWYMLHNNQTWVQVDKSSILETTYDELILKKFSLSYIQEWICNALPAKGFVCTSHRNTYIRNASGEWERFLNTCQTLTMDVQNYMKQKIEVIFICVQDMLRRSRKVLPLTDENKYYKSNSVIKFLFKKRNAKEDIFSSQSDGVSREHISSEDKCLLTAHLKSAKKLKLDDEESTTEQAGSDYKPCPSEAHLKSECSADSYVSTEEKFKDPSFSKKTSQTSLTPKYKKSVCTNVALRSFSTIPPKEYAISDSKRKSPRITSTLTSYNSMKPDTLKSTKVSKVSKQTFPTVNTQQRNIPDNRRFSHHTRQDPRNNDESLGQVCNNTLKQDSENKNARFGLSSTPRGVSKSMPTLNTHSTLLDPNNILKISDKKGNDSSTNEIKGSHILSASNDMSPSENSKNGVEQLKNKAFEMENMKMTGNIVNDLHDQRVSSIQGLPNIINSCSPTEVKTENSDQNELWPAELPSGNETSDFPLLLVLEEKLKSVYHEQCDWVNRAKWLAYKSLFSFVNNQGKLLKGVSKLWTSSCKSILLLGEAGFGKSAICTLITKMWAENMLTDFKLCFFISCSEIKHFDSLLNVLLKRIKQLLGEEFALHRNLIEKLLENKAEKILILFDGIDEMSLENRNRFLYSISDPSFLNLSNLIVTSRSIVVDKNVVQLFEQCLQIVNFNYKAARTLSLENSSKTLLFDKYWMASKAFYMTGLPPKYLYYFHKVFSTNTSYTDKETFFTLLYEITFTIAKEYGYELNHIEMLFRKLGLFCYKLLVLNRSLFPKQIFDIVFGDNQKSLLELGVFTTCRNKEQNGSVFECHKIFLVFFTTLFLCHKLDRVTNKDKIIEKYFCPDGTIGDFVVNYLHNGKKDEYQVGIFPEIALNISSGQGLQFMMYYDINCKSEMSSAFDSINLLLRVSPKHLARFAFEEKCDDTSIQEAFTDVINTFDFDGTVDMKFFINHYEKNNFLVWTMEDSESSMSVLQGVVAKRQEAGQSQFWYDKLHLTFRLSKVAKFAKVLQKLLHIQMLRDDFEKDFIALNLIQAILMALMCKKGNHNVSFSVLNSFFNDDSRKCSDTFSFDVSKNGTSLMAGAPFMDAASHAQDWESIASEINRRVRNFNDPLLSVYLK